MTAGRDAFINDLDVSRETLAKMDEYAARLKKWNAAINLVAKPTLDDLWSRHFLDSAQLLEFVPDDTRSWIDLGSGAGFPGLVVAALRPDISVTLVESDRRKAIFLQETARACSVDVTVVVERAEHLDIKADIVSARALAPLVKLLEMSDSLLAEGGKCLFLKGMHVENELTEANRVWHTELTQHQSRADKRGVVLEVTRFHRRTAE